MRLLDFLVEIFIAGFGITRPSEEKRRRVAKLLGGFLLLALLLFAALGAWMLYAVHASR